MITVTRLNAKEIVINSELIELIEANPDTTITITTGRKVIVLESVAEVMEKVIAYKQRIYQHIRLGHSST